MAVLVPLLGGRLEAVLVLAGAPPHRVHEPDQRDVQGRHAAQPDQRLSQIWPGWGELAELLNVTPTVLGSYLTAEAIPDPPAFLALRGLLKISPETGIDFWYIMLLAEQEPRKRTSNIKRNHVIDAALPDPLTATSAVDLRRKLREVHDWAMRPSYRELEEKTGGGLKKSTIGDMLHPERETLPRFDRYAHFLEACGVRDLTCWIAAWRRFAPPARQVRMIEQAAYAKLTEASRISTLRRRCSTGAHGESVEAVRALSAPSVQAVVLPGTRRW
ncbi:hypothetical protein AB0L71_20760 [Streptomyces sp. NPDC052052]|uniref:hypothetical protein n=1 Tax=Streptomyces sp. NPDC052052 TaxID=3154756 RepID=UPI00343E3CDA